MGILGNRITVLAKKGGVSKFLDQDSIRDYYKKSIIRRFGDEDMPPEGTPEWDKWYELMGVKDWYDIGVRQGDCTPERAAEAVEQARQRIYGPEEARRFIDDLKGRLGQKAKLLPDDAEHVSDKELKHGLTRDGKRYGVSIAKDKDGYFCYTHRARSKSYPSIKDIPKSALKFIDSTGIKKVEGKAEVYLGESGLDKSWQAEFPADAKCCRCGGDARIAYVLKENDPDIAALHDFNRAGADGGSLWLHDAGAFATYLCEKCLEPTTLYNQAMKREAKKDTVASALEFLMSMPLYDRDRNEGATVADEIASSKHGVGPESHRIYDALCLLFVDKNAGLMFGDMPISDALDKLKEMGYDGVTRRKTEGHEPLTAAKSKTLHIWDFDGTLIDTGKFQQDRIDDPKPIKKNLDRFKRQIADDADVIVMTARSNAGLVRRTLEDAGVNMTGIRIVALGTTANDAKGEYIARNFASKYDTITLYDDRKAYLDAAEEAMKDKGASFNTVKADKDGKKYPIEISGDNIKRYEALESADRSGKHGVGDIINMALERYWGILERELSSLLPDITASIRATGSAILECKNPITGEPGKAVYLHINNGGISFWVGEHKFVDQKTGKTLIFQPTIEMSAGHFGNVTNMMSILANPRILHDLAAYFEECAKQWDDVYVADDQLMDGPTEARVETVQASKRTGWRKIADVRNGESVYHRGAFIMAQSDWELLGKAGTDSGLLAITDPAYVVKKNSGERAVDEAVTSWTDLLDKNDSFKKPASVPFAAGHDGLMLVTPTGGEADYEVWGHYEDGDLIEIKIPIRKASAVKVSAGEMDRQHHYEVEARDFDTRGSLDAAFRGIQVYNSGMSREVVVTPENGKPIKIDFDGDGSMRVWCDTADYEDASTKTAHVYCNDAAQKSVEELLKALSKHNRLQLTIPDTDWTEIGDTGTFNGDEPVVTGWKEVEMTDTDRKKVEAAIVKKYQITYADGTCAFKDMTPNHAESMRDRDGVAAVALMDLPDEKIEAGNKNKGEYDLWGSIEKAVERGLLAYVGFMAADYLHQKKNASFGLENYRPVIDAYGEIGHSDKLTDEDKSVILKRLNDAGWDASDEGIEFLWNEILRHRQATS